EFESGKIESASCIKIADNFGDLFTGLGSS
ncbi:hypothetical protein H323_24665, partial [Vibrio parahaemolyticus VP766]